MKKLKKLKRVHNNAKGRLSLDFRIAEQKRVAARKASFIAALEASHGLVATAAREIGLSRKLHYEYYKNDKIYKEKVDAINEREIDFSVQKLRENIDRGKQASIFFHLKCRGGFVETNKYLIDANLTDQRIRIGDQDIEF